MNTIGMRAGESPTRPLSAKFGKRVTKDLYDCTGGMLS